MKTVLVSGADGMLGVDLVRRLRKSPYRILSSTIRSMDITKPDQVKKILFSLRPDTVIHTAAYTAVDKAETEQDLCMAVNDQGTGNISQVCCEIGAELIYISTDYVFDGTKDSPYVETDPPNPLNVYGRSKYLGEQAVMSLKEKYKICRTSWLIGLHGLWGTNFLEKIFKAAQTRKTLRVVADQIGSPTFTFDLALMLERLLALQEYGIFHVANSGSCSWYELAKTALEMMGERGVEILPIPSAQYPSPAKRPHNSILDCSRLARLGIPPLRPWKDALMEYLSRRKRMKKKS
jgi:dTDP-4-dehydrorhamnose reductase